jgi:hypothetical protein
MGLKGSGKTKQLIELVNVAVVEEKGNVICVELGKKLTYDINYKARLIDVSNFSITSFDMLQGFVSGLYAGNYDISHIFIDNIYKVSGKPSVEESEKFILWLEEFSKVNNVSFTVTISAPIEEASENIKKFL